MIANVIPINYDKHFKGIIVAIESAYQSNNIRLLDCLFEFLLHMYTIFPTQMFIPTIDQMLQKNIPRWVAFVQEKSMPSSMKFKLMDLEEAILRKKSL